MMEVKDYVKQAAEIWNEFRNSDGVPSDQQAKAILVAAVLAEVSKDRRMNRISEERRGKGENRGNMPMTQKQHDFFDKFGVQHDDKWTIAQASKAIDEQIAKWKGLRGDQP